MSASPAEEFAVVVAALLAGRIDGQQAVASIAALDRRFGAAAVDAARAEGEKQGAARVREAVEGLCADPWTATRVFGDPRYPEGVSRRGAVGYGAFVRVDALRAALTEAAPHD